MTYRKALALTGLCIFGVGLSFYDPHEPVTSRDLGISDPSSGNVGIVPTTRPARSPDFGGHAPPRPSEVRDMAIRDLGNFIYDPVRGGRVPEDVLRLHGMTVRLTGYMVPPDEAREVTHFELVPSLNGCCFGQPPGVQHTVLVTCDAGHHVTYSRDAVVVQGRLSVREIRDGEYIVSLFQLSNPVISFAGAPTR